MTAQLLCGERWEEVYVVISSGSSRCRDSRDSTPSCSGGERGSVIVHQLG